MPCCPTAPRHSSTNLMPPVTEPKVHIHIQVADLAKAMAFYRAFLGAEPVKTKPGYAKFLPAWAPLNLAMSERSGATGSTVSHLGIQLLSVAAVQDQLQRARAAGLTVREEIGVTCCHANQDKFWVTDPDGVDWEVYHLNFDVEDQAVRQPPSTCCAG